jgi:hypothetical protein
MFAIPRIDHENETGTHTLLELRIGELCATTDEQRHVIRDGLVEYACLDDIELSDEDAVQR